MRNQGVFPGFLIVIVVEPATLKKRLLVNWLAPKKGAIFSFIYFLKSFCIYYIPHNYAIPQTMPHAIPQTYSSFHPHRFYLPKRKVVQSLQDNCISVLAFLISFTNCSRKLASLLSGKFYHIGILERSIENKRLVEWRMSRSMQGNPKQSWILNSKAEDSGFQALHSGYLLAISDTSTICMKILYAHMFHDFFLIFVFKRNCVDTKACHLV